MSKENRNQTEKASMSILYLSSQTAKRISYMYVGGGSRLTVLKVDAYSNFFFIVKADCQNH